MSKASEEKAKAARLEEIVEHAKMKQKALNIIQDFDVESYMAKHVVFDEEATDHLKQRVAGELRELVHQMRKAVGFDRKDQP